MSYIEREALLKNRYNIYVGFLGSVPVVNVKDIDNAPAADVVEVVRCKDCREWTELLLDNLPASVGDCRCNLMTTDAHFYCAYGERRTDHVE